MSQETRGYPFAFQVLRAMSESESRKVEAIRTKAGKTPGNFSVYRDRLIKKGIIISSEYGYLEFALLRFREFVKHFSVG
jgi:hypothetical protein